MSNIKCGRCKTIIGTEKIVHSKTVPWDIIREYNQPWIYDYKEEEFVCLECDKVSPVPEEDKDLYLPWQELKQ